VVVQLKWEEQYSLWEAVGAGVVVQQHFVVEEHQHWEFPQGLEVVAEGEGQLGGAETAVNQEQELVLQDETLQYYYLVKNDERWVEMSTAGSQWERVGVLEIPFHENHTSSALPSESSSQAYYFSSLDSFSSPAKNHNKYYSTTSGYGRNLVLQVDTRKYQTYIISSRN